MLWVEFRMLGKVRLPAPEVVSTLLDVGHTFPTSEGGVFRGTLLAIEDGWPI